MSDTPQAWCPTCRPDADEIAEFLMPEFCSVHRPDISGSADALVVSDNLWSVYSPAEAEAITNRAICAVVHRDRAEVE